MKFWVGLTDYEWFKFLAALKPDELNFWQPSSRHSFSALRPGEVFLFKLHSPRDFIKYKRRLLGDLCRCALPVPELLLRGCGRERA